MGNKIELKRLVVCTCGRMHFSIPETTKHQQEGDAFDGYYWNCVCNSTLFVPENQLNYFLTGELGKKWKHEGENS